MTKINFGRVAPINKGEYSSSAQYTRMDVVTYGGSSYWCIQPCTGIDPTNTTYWKLLAAKGEQGIQGEKGDRGEHVLMEFEVEKETGCLMLSEAETDDNMGFEIDENGEFNVILTKDEEV